MKKDQKEKKDEKIKMVILIPQQTFGYDGRAYRAGEEYVVAQSKLPTAMKKKYKIETVKTKKVEKKGKGIPVVGK